MGQATVGLLYGCEAPHFDEEDGLYELIGRFEKNVVRKNGRRVRVEQEGGLVLVGVWVAVCGSEDGVRYLFDECVQVGELVGHYKEDIDKAIDLWNKFARYVLENESVKLGYPTLWFTPCEVA